jgi:NAD-dependent dihydropyrimidine dehydrogenase PreA subunit
MAGLFIDVVIDGAIRGDAAAAKKLAEVCPVDIFEASDAGVAIIEANLDECTLCDLCVQAFPGQVEVKKLYEE